MSSSNRTDVLKRFYSELKKKFSAVEPVERTVLEHFLYATCLEDATFEAADTAFNALVQTMSGWNEVRVSSTAELAELMPQLPDPRGTAVKIRKILRSVFEERYTFDLDDIRKKNIKEAYEKLESIPGGTPFSINYTAQVAFGRHGIPVGNGEKRLLYVLGIISEKDIEQCEVAGLNRAISKSQGMEFFSLVHQMAAMFVQNPEARKIISFLKAFAPDFRDRMPRRREVRIENSMETPEPVVVPKKENIEEVLKNDPDYYVREQEDRYEDIYENQEELAKQTYLEEIARGQKRGKGSRSAAEEQEEAVEKPVRKSVKSKKQAVEEVPAEAEPAAPKKSVKKGAKEVSEVLPAEGPAGKKTLRKSVKKDAGPAAEKKAVKKADPAERSEKGKKAGKAAKAETSAKAEKAVKASAKSEKTAETKTVKKTAKAAKSSKSGK